ncbi:hypothetical protein U4I65_13335, partial [Stenotrophomonas maltophilia]|uniref:hypothetical protein n=1 Tax=Stenotrophomonas maltophilia TaxID=40324 RepID=UPI002ACC84EF
VGAMDGAIEPPWMGLRRVLQTHPARPLTVSCARPTTEKKIEKQKRVARCARSVSTKVDTYQQPQEPVEGGALWVCGV